MLRVCAVVILLMSVAIFGFVGVNSDTRTNAGGRVTATGPSSDGLILEDGSGYLELETGDYLLLE